MWYKVKYPDCYIRETRSIIAAAELTYVYRGSETGEFVVSTGVAKYVLHSLGEALDWAASHILGDGPADEVTFNYDSELDAWVPDIAAISMDIKEATRAKKK